LKDHPFLIAIESTRLGIRALSCFVVSLVFLPAHAQFDDDGSYQFLHIPVSSRMAGLGGVNVSLADRDVNFFYANPALNGDTLVGMASVNYQFYAGDVGHAGITYAHDFKRLGMLTMGVQHMSYGSIEAYDATGRETGTFNSQETALAISRSHQIRNYRFGLTLKGIFSNYAGFRSTGIAFDIGGTFIHPEKPLTIGLVLRNPGIVISDFSGTANSTLPLDVQAGVSFKPEFMPMRFSIAAFNLTGQKIRGAEGEVGNGGLVQNVLSHFNFGGEVLVHRNVQILVGYNYWRHRELRLESGGAGAGLSIGLSASVKSIDFVFSRAGYVAGSAAYSFTLSSDINKYLKRRSL